MNKTRGNRGNTTGENQVPNTTSKKPSLLKYHYNQVFYAKNITMHYLRG
jgi:hypothetical protein